MNNGVNKTEIQDIIFRILEGAIKTSFASYINRIEYELKKELIINKTSKDKKQDKTDDEILEKYLVLTDKIYNIIVHSLLDFINVAEEYNKPTNNNISLVDVEYKMNIFLKNIKCDREDIKTLLRIKRRGKTLDNFRGLERSIMDIAKESKLDLTEIVHPDDSKQLITNGINGTNMPKNYRLIKEALNKKAMIEKLQEENSNRKMI